MNTKSHYHSICQLENFKIIFVRAPSRVFYFPGSAANVVAYGHLGDGNLHLNISTEQYNDSVMTFSLVHLPFEIICFNGQLHLWQILSKIEPFVYEWTSKHHGSISAEHGLGLMKASKIHYSKSAETVSITLLLIRCIGLLILVSLLRVLNFCLLHF